MKKQGLALGLSLIFSMGVVQADEAPFFERPVSCPLRLSNLSALRDSIQILHASLGPDCAQNSQGALNSLTSSMTNLEGITNTFNTYSNGDSASDTTYAKNVNQILGSLNVITSNTQCVYDIRKRGMLPVLSDVIMSVSQLGLLVPSGTGLMVSAGGYVAGSALKIINELIKDKFNFNRPEDRKTFMQLNCSFFDARKAMEEAGIFDLATDEYRKEYAAKLRRERAELIKEQRRRNDMIGQMDTQINEVFRSLPEAGRRNFDPNLLKKLDELSTLLGSHPGDYAKKWKQVSGLAKEANSLLRNLDKLDLDNDSLVILRQNLDKIMPDLAEGGKAWDYNLDEWEMKVRGPLVAFIVPVANALRSEISRLEDDLALSDPKAAMDLSRLKAEIKDISSHNWILSQRIASLETKIANLEKKHQDLFSELDEGTSNEVEILEYYRKLQNSILGKEGRNYLNHAIKNSSSMGDAVDRQVQNFHLAKDEKEKCAAAEKLRFAWTHYRYKAQEAHDFVTTNLDLYRSSFRVGKEKLKKNMRYVLNQIESVEVKQKGGTPAMASVGELMNEVETKIVDVERLIHQSGCF